MLDEVRCLSAIRSMPITHSKQVAVRRFIHVWMKDKTVLVHFVGVVRDVAYPGGKCVLCDYVPFDVKWFAFIWGDR